MTAKRIDTLALFAALSLFLSIIELLIPKPFPFFRIGLANLPLLVALTFFSPGEFILLIFLKIFGQAIVGGTLFSYVFLFSAVGSISSGLMMLLLRSAYPRFISTVGISVAGAFVSNCAQLLFAAWIIFGRSTRLIAPPFLVIGLVSGIILGITAEFVLHHSRWLKEYLQNKDQADVRKASNRKTIRRDTAEGNRRDILLLLCGLLMIPPFILQPDPVFKALHVMLFVLYGVLLGKRIRLVPGIVLMLSVTAASALNPLGEVVLTIGGFPVTAGAVRQGFLRGMNLIGMVYLSRCTISPRLRMPGEAGRLFYRVFYYFEEISSIRLEKSRVKGLMPAVREKLLYLDDRLLKWEKGEIEGFGNSRPGGQGKESGYKPWIPPSMLLTQWILFFLQKIGQ